MKMEKTVKSVEKAAGNTIAKGQLEKQSDFKKKIFFFTFLKNILDFSALNYLPAPLPTKPKKRKKREKDCKFLTPKK